MIIEIKVANYRSINAEQTLSFVADRATRHSGNLIKRPGYRLLKAVGMFGANASGKSNFVKAIGEMSEFVRDSATKMNDGDPILAAEPYRLDPVMRDKPSRFEITFVTDGTVYTYGFAADSERVHEEWLTATLESNDKKLFDIKRSTHDTLGGSIIDVRYLPPSVSDLLAERTRDNALFLSTAARENVKELLPIFRHLRDEVAKHDMTSDLDDLKRIVLNICEEYPQYWRQMVALLRDADTGIDEIILTQQQIESKDSGHATIGQQLEQLRKFIESLRNPIRGHQISLFRRDLGGESVAFDFEHDESNGTQRVFILAGLFINALASGEFLVIDELDTSMHPLLTYRLLEMFQSPKANPNGAQLLFTTHDAVLLDSALFRRDQIVLAEKRGGASHFFSLADIEPPIRNTESFLRNYLAGRYGGTALFGRTFEELELAPAQ